VRYLLDVNALIAAIWKDHVDHAKADSWVADKDLATCPLSELGFLRVSTQPKAIGASMRDARRLLDDFLTKHATEFIPADLPALQSKPARSQEVTDHYLAELAARKGFKLATLDCNIVHAAVEVIQ
jgi:toxin-antitoxin system PIN domain toxin